MHAQSKTIWLFEIFICKAQLEIKRVKIFSVRKAKISRQINDIRDTGPDTENTDHGPDIVFYGPLVNQSE
jgi:hypothetical protein